MGAKTVTITNQKGGCGKTATAAALGAGLTNDGARVLYIDLDPQGSLSYTLRANTNTPGAAELLAGRDPAECIQTTPDGDAIAADPRLAPAAENLTDSRRAYHLRDALRTIRGKYDYIVIDTAPELGILTTNALTAADGVIIPATPGGLVVRGIDQLADTIRAVKRINKPLRVYGILLTRYDRRKVLHQQAAEQMEKRAAALGTKIYKTRLRECVAIDEAQTIRENIFSYAPRSNAAKQYREWIDEVKGDF